MFSKYLFSKPSQEQPEQDDGIDKMQACLISIHSSDQDRKSSDPQLLSVKQNQQQLAQQNQQSKANPSNTKHHSVSGKSIQQIHMISKKANSDNGRNHIQQQHQQQHIILSQQKISNSNNHQKKEQFNNSDDDDDRQFDIQETIDFNDDLLESIRDPSTKINLKTNNEKEGYKKFANNRQLEIDNFSQIIQQSHASSQISQQSSNQATKTPRFSFSDLNQSRDFKNFQQSQNDSSNANRNKDNRLSFSDLNNYTQEQINCDDDENNNCYNNYNNQSSSLSNNYNNAFSKQKQSGISSNGGNTFPSLDDQIDLWGPSEKVEKSNLNIKNKYIKRESPQTQKIEDPEIIDVNKSILTQRMPPKNFSSPNKTQSVRTTQKVPSKKQQCNYQKQTIQNDFIDQRSMQQSYYMKPIQQPKNKKVPVQKENSRKYSQNKEDDLQSSGQIQIVQMDCIVFLKYKASTQEMSEKLLNRIVQFFLAKGIMIPLFNYKLLESHKQKKQNQSQFDIEVLEKSVVDQKDSFIFYTEYYFSFICERYPDYVKDLFKDLKKAKSDGASNSSLMEKKVKKPVGDGIFSMLADYFKKRPYSKAEILKNAQQKKLECMQSLYKEWFNPMSNFQIVLKKSKSEKQLSDKQVQLYSDFSSKTRKIQKYISNLQMLISFQHSELYCEKKLEQSLEQNIWKQRKTKLIKDRNWYIDNMFQSISI